MWYATVDGEVEYYTFPWIHPVNGEPLKPVTPDIAGMYSPEQKATSGKNDLASTVSAMDHGTALTEN